MDILHILPVFGSITFEACQICNSAIYQNILAQWLAKIKGLTQRMHSNIWKGFLNLPMVKKFIRHLFGTQITLTSPSILNINTMPSKSGCFRRFLLFTGWEALSQQSTCLKCHCQMHPSYNRNPHMVVTDFTSYVNWKWQN